MLQKDVQLELPLDERYRQAEQYAFDLPPQGRQQPPTEVEAKADDGSCPYHKAFVYNCPYCNPH